MAHTCRRRSSTRAPSRPPDSGTASALSTTTATRTTPPTLRERPRPGPPPPGGGPAHARVRCGMAGRETLAAAGRLEGFARRRLALPGLAVGLIGPGGWRHEFAVGVADAASGRALEPGAPLPVASVGKGHDGRGPAPRAPGRAGRPGRPRPRPAALAAPADPVRAGPPAPPAGPHRRDRVGDGGLPLADPRGHGPGPD